MTGDKMKSGDSNEILKKVLSEKMGKLNEMEDEIKKIMIDGVESWVLACEKEGLYVGDLRKVIFGSGKSVAKDRVKVCLDMELNWGGMEAIARITINGDDEVLSHYVKVDDFEKGHLWRRVCKWLGDKIGQDIRRREPMKGVDFERLLKRFEKKARERIMESDWEELRKGLRDGVNEARRKSSIVDELNKKLNEMAESDKPRSLGEGELAVKLDSNMTTIREIWSGATGVEAYLSLSEGWDGVERKLTEVRRMEDRVPEMTETLTELIDDLNDKGIYPTFLTGTKKASFKVELGRGMDLYNVMLVLEKENGEFDAGFGSDGEDFSRAELRNRVLRFLMCRESSENKKRWSEMLALKESSKDPGIRAQRKKL